MSKTQPLHEEDDAVLGAEGDSHIELRNAVGSDRLTVGSAGEELNGRAFAMEASACHANEAAGALGAVRCHLSGIHLGREPEHWAQFDAGDHDATAALRALRSTDGSMMRSAALVGASPSTSPRISPFPVGCLAGSLYDQIPERIRTAYPMLQIRLVALGEEAMTEQVLAGCAPRQAQNADTRSMTQNIAIVPMA